MTFRNSWSYCIQLASGPFLWKIYIFHWCFTHQKGSQMCFYHIRSTTVAYSHNTFLTQKFVLSDYELMLLDQRPIRLLWQGVADSHVSANYWIVFRWYFEPDIILSVMCMRFYSLASRLCWSISVCEWSAFTDPRHALVSRTAMIWANGRFFRKCFIYVHPSHICI